ncbi:MAG: RmlD substrate binding domain, partial [Bacteroidota bacterium]
MLDVTPRPLRILVTGANGLLGQSLLYLAQGRHELLATGRGPARGNHFGFPYAELDTTRPEDFERVLTESWDRSAGDLAWSADGK